MRSGRSRMPLPLALALLALLALPGLARAAWPHDPTVNLPVCVANTIQYYPKGAPDGAGGTILAWMDYRTSNEDIYAQHLDEQGNALWAANGIPVCTMTGDQSYPTVISDGVGGAIIVWTDARAGNDDIYVQRLDAQGNALWGANGLAICTQTLEQIDPAIALDGSGGAYITWQDARSGNDDIYAQRVSAAGAIQWAANGLVVCAATGNQTVPAIAFDAWNCADIVWQDYRGGATSDIYMQRMSLTGAAQWSANGLPVCNAANGQTYPSIVQDGMDGVFVCWRDYRSGTSWDIYAQRVNTSGSPYWTANGVGVATGTDYQDYSAMVADGAGGAVIAWEDGVGSAYNLFAQRLNLSGAALWGASGVALSSAGMAAAGPALVPDGTGGAIVTWEDNRNGNTDLYAQRVNGGGAVMWNAAAVAVCTAPYGEGFPTISGDGAGNAIIAWHDQRSMSTDHIYAQRVDEFGVLGGEPVIAAIADVPDDQGGKIKVSWAASPLDVDPAFRNVASYLLFRSAPPNLVARARRAGVAVTDAGALEPGTAPGRLVRTSARGATYYWEYLGAVTAYHLPAYSAIVPTTADSVAGSCPLTAFMVEARTSGGTQWWFSEPDSGYSTDDLPPPAPAPFTGQYAAGSTSLLWGASTASDLACYRLYRGSVSRFVPSPANLVASPTTTNWLDAAGGPYYYRLSAVDVHGNEGPNTFLMPAGTTDAPATTLPRELWLGRATPNPARGAATIRFGLPRATAVRMTLLDAQGRRVRTLLSGVEPAGERTLGWDGRDDAGRPLPSGLYLCRLACGAEVRSQRIALTH